ncbi:MAG: PAC2 family protein, partial [Candidatus Aenigmatarchaeota archaeon]
VRGMKGVCLLGETVGLPIIPDHKSAEVLLKVITKILNVKIDTSKIEKKIKEMEDFIRKIEDVQKRALGQLLRPMEKPEKEEKLSYIG